MPIIIIPPPRIPDIATLKKENETEQEVLEFTHLVRSHGMPLALVMMFYDIDEDCKAMSDLAVAWNMAFNMARVAEINNGHPPTILPIYGWIPPGEKFAGRKYALKVIFLDEALQEIQLQREAAAAASETQEP